MNWLNKNITSVIKRLELEKLLICIADNDLVLLGMRTGRRKQQ